MKTPLPRPIPKPTWLERHHAGVELPGYGVHLSEDTVSENAMAVVESLIDRAAKLPATAPAGIRFRYRTKVSIVWEVSCGCHDPYPESLTWDTYAQASARRRAMRKHHRDVRMVKVTRYRLG